MTVPVDTPLHPLPTQAHDVDWPTLDWPPGHLPTGVDIDGLIEEAFDPDGPLHETFAVVVIHRGRLVFERYAGLLPQWDKPGKPVVRETPLLSWSMAKSMLHAVVGMLVDEGRLVLDAPAPVPAWSAPDDPRHAITLQNLLDMRDGLAFNESYEEPETSDVMAMLFGRGQSDMAAFAADRPLAAPPGTRFNYSTGTSLIVSSMVARVLGPGEPYRAFLDSRLLGPLGMRTATVTFDEAGTWVAGSYAYATARDYARFGLLYCATACGRGSTCCRPAGSTTAVDPARSTPTTVTTTAPTGGPGRDRTAPSGPPATRVSTSISARTSIWFWCGWAGPTPTTARTSRTGAPGSSGLSPPPSPADPPPVPSYGVGQFQSRSPAISENDHTW